MTYEEWAATVGRGVTITPEMAFEAGAASRDAEMQKCMSEIARKGAERAIERCKDSTGQRHQIDLYVSANQCAEDVVEALAKVRKP